MIKGTGSRLENETVILFNDAEDTAIVSTASPPVYRKLVKRGFVPRTEWPHRALFEIPKAAVRLPTKPRRRLRQNPPPDGGFQTKSGHSGGVGGSATRTDSREGQRPPLEHESA
jgi:hypothetical protein